MPLNAATLRRALYKMGLVNAAGNSASLIHQAMATLTDAQIKALPTTWPEIIAAPGIGKLVVLTSAILFHSGGTDVGLFESIYTNGSLDFPSSSLYLAYGADFQLATYLIDPAILRFLGRIAISIPAIDGLFTGGGGVAAAQADSDNVLNQPIQLVCYNTAGNFTGGHPNNRLHVSVAFVVLNLVTGRLLTNVESGWDETTRTFN